MKDTRRCFLGRLELCARRTPHRIRSARPLNVVFCLGDLLDVVCGAGELRLGEPLDIVVDLKKRGI